MLEVPTVWLNLVILAKKLGTAQFLHIAIWKL
jgi:hypothetical protein